MLKLPTLCRVYLFHRNEPTKKEKLCPASF
ncbi:hypothetical protein CPL00160_CDS0050 [Escherchia phage Tuinin]